MSEYGINQAWFFHSQKNLRSLDLSFNRIQILRTEWFENLEQLVTLYLENNKIEELPKHVFSSLKTNVFIALNNNRLSVIHADSIGFSINLSFVIFTENQINAIDEIFIDNNPALFSISMLDNLCASVTIFDNSISRQSMREQLQTCFENYETLYPGMIYHIFFYKN